MHEAFLVLTFLPHLKKVPSDRLHALCRCHVSWPVPSENLIRWIRSRKENRIMIETDGDLLQTSARIYVGLLSFA
jgi:hypothetical protein